MPTQHRGARVLLILAALVIVLFGINAAAEQISSILVAAFLAVLCVPPMRRLQEKGIPEWAALLLVMLGATFVVVLISVVIGTSVNEFKLSMPKYQARLADIVRDLGAWLDGHGFAVDQNALAEKLNSGRIMTLVGKIASGLMSALSDVLLVVLTMIFILLEVNGLKRKLLRIVGSDLSEFSRAALQVQRYIATKTLVSLATGFLVGMLCFLCDVDFPLLWALLAFLFNFIPNIGSVIAAIPAILVALLDQGPGLAGIVGAGYFAINMIIGNVVEPKLLGRRLGLSTLVVFLSMVVWGWILGSIGMVLSVPLTVVIKIILEHSDDFKSVAILLGPGNESDEDAGAPPAKTATG